MKHFSTLDQFKEKAIKIHGNKYSYEKVIYKDSKTKVIVTCIKHGDFLISPNKLLCNRGCPGCGIESRTTSEENFIAKANKIHKNKFKYSNYTNTNNYITVTCPVHGNFEQIASEHLRGRGCSACSNVKQLTQQEFIDRANKVHNNFFDYSKTNYKNMKTKVIITCPVHGDFEQIPHSHIILGNGCSKCANVYSPTKEEFISQAKIIHNDKYNYSKVTYTNNYTKVTITCPMHGDFQQRPRDHVNIKSGCPTCNSSKGELAIKAILDKYNFNYKKEFMFLNQIYKFRYDFCIIDLKILIEFHGQQHYEYIPYFHKEEDTFLLQKERDIFKRELAKELGYNLIEINYKQFDNFSQDKFEQFIISKINLLKEILNN